MLPATRHQSEQEEQRGGNRFPPKHVPYGRVSEGPSHPILTPLELWIAFWRHGVLYLYQSHLNLLQLQPGALRRSRETGVADRFQGKEDTAMTNNHWRPYGSYSNAELQAVTFPSVEEIDRAIDVIFKDSDLKGLPFDTPDGMTLFVPTESVALLQAKDLKFSVSNLLSPDDLDPESLAEMRAKHGM